MLLLFSILLMFQQASAVLFPNMPCQHDSDCGAGRKCVKDFNQNPPKKVCGDPWDLSRQCVTG